MEYTKVEFTDEQRKELIRLMVGLNFVELKAKFDMNDYASEKSEYGGHSGRDKAPGEVRNECGTCACAMGHAPMFCETLPERDDDWDDYQDRLFGDLGPLYGQDSVSGFIFDDKWPDSWQEAVARIHTVLTRGVPALGYSDGSDRYEKPSDLTIEC